MGTDKVIFAKERLRRNYRKWYRAHAWPEVTSVTCPEAALFGSMLCACATGSWAISALVGTFHRKWQSRDRKRPCPALLFFRTFFLYFSPRTFFPFYFFLVLLFPVLLFPYFFSRIFFPYFFFPLFFSVLFQKLRRLKSNVLKYQWVVFLVHVDITQFMFLAEYPFKRHP